MKNSPEKSFTVKLYIIIGLSAVIFSGLLYLIVSGGADKIYQTASSSSTAVPSETAAVTAAPASSASAAETAAPTASPSAVPDTSSDTALLRIVNKTYLLDSSYVPSNLTVPNVSMNHEQTLRKEAASALEQMFAAADKEGISLYLISGYRSYEEQRSLYWTYSDEYGREFADSIDATPGASEHQLGLAADIGTESHACELQQCFDATDAFAWLQTHAAEYGYILRDPQGKQDSTGISYAPWSYRYVGTEAVKIAQSGKTMEEYYGK
ncbi:MAG: M15 family metallopeptidase [Solobacterium sp.]|jgi:D-alanyl-D-alanine carboxypeptidase|nr:M15 family metallopeptidase [Solobacterium sp.]MCH4282082.1 M15 family metallopeptidase [Solobacterium sp.]